MRKLGLPDQSWAISEADSPEPVTDDTQYRSFHYGK
jgi:hypothetical protein